MPISLNVYVLDSGENGVICIILRHREKEARVTPKGVTGRGELMRF